MSVVQNQILAGKLLANACAGNNNTPESQARVVVGIALMRIDVDAAVRTLEASERLQVVAMLDDESVRDYIRKFNYSFEG